MTFRALIAGAATLLVAVALITPTAEAGYSTGLLVPYEINKLEDNDWETLVNWDGDEYQFFNPAAYPQPDSILDVNDILVGMFRIQELHAPPSSSVLGTWGDTPPPADAFVGVFVLKVLSKDTTDPYIDSGVDYTFGPAPDAAWTFLGLSRTDANTMTILYEDDDSPYIQPIDDDLTIDALKAALATGADGTELWEFGFQGESGEGWEAFTNTDNVLLVDPTGASGFRAALNVTDDTGAGVELLYHQHIGGEIPNTFFTDPTQLQLAGGFDELVDGDPDTTGFQSNVLPVGTDTDLYIKPTPEPSTWIALLGLALMGLIWRWRRFK